MYKIITGRTLLIAFFCLLTILFFVIEPLILLKDNHFFTTENDKTRFFESIGVSVSEKPPVREEIYIPENFNDILLRYNDLQQKAGYNLKDFAGKTVVKETYYLKDVNDSVVNVLLYNNRVIGGDISTTLLDGEMFPLKLGSFEIGE